MDTITFVNGRLRWAGLALALFCGLHASTHAEADVVLVRGNRVVAEVVVIGQDASPSDLDAMKKAGEWLASSLKRATNSAVTVRQSDRINSRRPTVALKVLPHDRSRNRGMPLADNREAYRVTTLGNRVEIVGRSGVGVRHGVAALLEHLGFRFYAPSPHWHHVPDLQNVSLDWNVVDSPALRFRRIWYAYGMPGDDLRPLMDHYKQWCYANRLSLMGVVQTGHSYGNIIGRNESEFESHPEYFALLPDGTRDSSGPVNARKFCFSNPGLIDLVCRDRVRLLGENRKRDPSLTMVSVDPSDGQGTCHCTNCEALGTTTDRVFYLANAVARAVRQADQEAWVGLYAYSTHRLPPTIDVEPNVYVQVAMGFNHTQYTLPELVGLWSQKVSAIGLREYYGVEAWDWGLPGRLRGGNPDYHRQWIPYYAKRNLDAVNAETNANWGAQMLGLAVAARLMWDPDAETESVENEFFELCYGNAVEPMRRFHAAMQQSPPLRPGSLLPMCDGLHEAFKDARRPEVRRRIIDMMAYMLFVGRYREFDLVRGARPERDDAYYDALKPLMNYVWRIRHRDIVHYYALARRLCNGLPLGDGRQEFYLGRKEKPAIWMSGEQLRDVEIVRLFDEMRQDLTEDDDPTVAFSRLLSPLTGSGDDAGASRLIRGEVDGEAKFRSALRGHFFVAEASEFTIEVSPTSKTLHYLVRDHSGRVLNEATVEGTDGVVPIDLSFPRGGDYQIDFRGDFSMRVDENVPFVFEASPSSPAWIDYCGPHYFYVPVGTDELFIDANPRVSLFIAGETSRVDVTPATRVQGKQYSRLKVPEGADGKVWHTSPQTRGNLMLLNVPPLLSMHRSSLLVPREVVEVVDK